ncbi:MAG: heavy-metal-associated domain-containing protein [Clostridia bacterium]|nr:heavy-metal-associated domain-containing protein [Clostridia bacterium]
MLVKVLGMMCEHCKKRVENALLALGAKNVSVSLESESVYFEGVSLESAITAIEDLGFEAEK